MTNATRKISPEDALLALLLAQQPEARGTVETLRQHYAAKGGYGAFAPITSGCCAACRMTVAKVKQQRAMNGAFITCANCARFLYLADRIGLESSDVPANPS